jgi:carboxyl-terminal processing protease
MLEGNIGYIKIENFEAGAADGFKDAVEELVGDGAASFIYDVRNNRGGRVSELRQILDRLLPECEIFVAVDKDKNEDISYSDETSLGPAGVRVNGYSYSAAEYFAAVLQEYGYATVVGEPTTGKSRSQITLTLPDGGALHISSGEYLTPNRVSLTEQGGIRPDVEIVLSDEDNALLYAGTLDSTDDSQLQKAIELLSAS